MKNKKIISILFLLIIFIANISFASYENVIMSVVEEPICTIEFGENSNFEKKLFSKDLNNKEVTLQLQVTNNEKALKPTGEIMLVIDNSDSMNTVVSTDVTREDLVIESAKTLIKNLLTDNTDLKIGAVSFSTNSDISKEGTIEDAKLISELTNDSEALITAVSNIEYNGPRTNLDSGLTLASQYFTESEDSNKYVIVLTDGVPNVAVGNNKVYYSDEIITQTKTTLQSLSSKVDTVITMLTGITNGDAPATGVTKTYNEIIEEVFGTTTNPTTGKFYYVTDSEIEETITQNIYNDLMPISQSLYDIKIVDYFPKEIIENFEFSYVSEANIGTISAEVNKTNNSITWTIPELKSGETAKVQYKLKLIENYDSKIVDKILNTNEKVDLTYTDFSGNEDSKTSDISPKIKLTEPKPTELPKAGKTMFFTFIGIAVLIVVISGTKYFKIKTK